ncbi:cysteine desulfurase [Clostridia bacterium]|nr:cysteine desulfurase [Clostridia bacterium]
MEQTAYFDNAATTFPKPEEVYTFTDIFYRECGVNVGRGQHNLASKASALVAETRELLLNLFHCPNKKVVFAHTATEALNTILRGLKWCDGMNVYISPFEHNAVTRVLHHLRQNYSLNIHTLSFDITVFDYAVSKIQEQFIASPPSVVIISHASNICGVVAPITKICSLSKKHGAVNVIDMCQTAGLIDSVLSLETIDYAVFAGHKTLYSPFGVAGFICKPTIKLIPLMFGGTGVDSASQELPETVPERYEVASPNIAAIAGLNASLKWIGKVGIANIYNKEQENRNRLITLLQQYNNIKIVSKTDGENFIGVVSCVFDEYGSDNIGQILSDKGVAVRTGLHCAPTAHKFLGTFPGGTVRFSVSYFNDDNDFTALEQALSYIQENS